MKALRSKEDETQVSLGEQLYFFAPMAATSLLMAITHSLFNAGLARLSRPEIYLAAFAVAKSLVHFIESPVMMVRQVVSTLINNAQNYHTVKKFMLGLASILFLVLGLALITGGARWIFSNIIGVEAEILDEAVIIFSVLIFFPFAAGLRNFMQGVAINLDKTPLFTIATLIRIVYVIILVSNIEKITFFPDGILAGLMFFGAVMIEGLVLLIGVIYKNGDLAKAHENKMNKNKRNSHSLNNGIIMAFFGPLILTSFIHNIANPLVNIGLARTSSPEIAISTYAVAWGLGMIVISPMFMFHQVAIKYIKNESENIAAVKRFGFFLGSIITVIMILLSFTEIGYYILRNWIGATEEISILSIDVLKLMILVPTIITVREYYWGLLMKKRYTSYITKGKIVNLSVLSVSILSLIVLTPANPALLGPIAIMSCESAELAYLYKVNQGLK
ncbi:MAG: hypothetical protein ACOC3B_03065, partial [Bacillota bacterium]